MQKVFYIFRHGETDYNKERRWQGCGIDAPLNSKGVEQAKQLTATLANKDIQIIYSSPLQRALKTAHIVADSLNIPIKIIPNLREGNFGQAEGMLKTEIAIKFKDIFQEWYSDTNNMDICFPQGETKHQMQQRMLDVLDQLLKKPETVVGIASHGSSIRYLLMHFGYQPHKMQNTALYRLEYEDGIWRLEVL